jgi:4,5-DOPA dioxygenase extradiol
LRDAGVLIVGSGTIVHNLQQFAFGADKPFDWAQRFDQWIGDRLERRAVEEIVNYRSAPGAALAVPTPEHFDPLLFALGAARGDPGRQFFHAIRHASLAMRLLAFGSDTPSLA